MKSLKHAIWLQVVLLVAAVLPVQAEKLIDPTKPSYYVAPAKKDKAKLVLKLQSVLVSKNRKLATINDKTYSIGEQVAGYKLIAVYQDHVILSGKGREMRLSVLDNTVRNK